MKKVQIVTISVWGSWELSNCRHQESKIRFDLSDGRTIVIPMKWYPKLEKATFRQRNNWRLVGNGKGAHWPDIDEVVSLKDILDGKPSVEYSKCSQEVTEDSEKDNIPWTKENYIH